MRKYTAQYQQWFPQIEQWTERDCKVFMAKHFAFYDRPDTLAGWHDVVAEHYPEYLLDAAVYMSCPIQAYEIQLTDATVWLYWDPQIAEWTSGLYIVEHQVHYMDLEVVNAVAKIYNIYPEENDVD